MFVIAVLSAAQLLLQPTMPVTPYNDLQRHTALALNFKEALSQWQIIPRLQPNPAYLPDMPTFQYYGFVSSAFTQFGIWIGMEAFRAMIFGVILCRFIGLLTLYSALKRLNFSMNTALISSAAYVFFPYCQTNLYGRIAIAEACAQGLLPLLIYAWVNTLSEKKIAVGVIFTTITIILLTLTHPIFLLWSTFTLGFFAVLGIVLSKRDRFKKFKWTITGIVFGLFTSAFQWLPAFLSKSELKNDFAVRSPFFDARFTSLSGFFGWPEKLALDGTEYYFTGTAWIFPVLLIAAILTYRNSRRDLFSYSQLNVLIGSSIILIFFLLLAISPFDIWAIMPKLTYATQFPYRMFAFVGLFSVILLAFSLEKFVNSAALRWVFGFFAIALSGPALVAPYNIYGDRFPIFDDQQILANFSLDDYSVPRKNKITDQDGWLLRDNEVYIPESIFRDGRWFSPSNVAINVQGKIGLKNDNKSFVIWFADAEDENKKISEDFLVNEDSFNHTFYINSTIKKLRLISSRSLRPTEIDSKNLDSRNLPIIITAINFTDAKLVSSDLNETKREIIGPYSRKFTLPGNVSANQEYILPIAYSRFFKFTQNDKQLAASQTTVGLTEVITENINTPIIANYQIPIYVTLISIFGLIISMLFIAYHLPLKKFLPKMKLPSSIFKLEPN